MTPFTTAVVGFQEKETNALILFKDFAYPELKTITVPRAYTIDYQLCMPSTVFDAVDFYLIDLDGIGLTLYDNDVTVKIMAYTKGKPTILVSRYGLSQWQNLSLSPQWQFLSAHYKRQDIQTAIDQAITAILSTPHHATTTPLNTQPTVQKNVMDTPIATTFDQLNATFSGIDTHFYFILFRQIALLTTYTKLSIENHSLYINPFDKSAIVHRLGSLIDRLSILRRSFSHDLLKIEPLDETQFTQQTQILLKAGDKKMPINQMIWQMGLELVSSKEFSQSHTLCLKVNYMPNLTGINYVPSYVIPIIASCLGKAKPFIVLQTSFPNLTNGQLNQVIILMVCSQIIDTAVLLTPQTAFDSQHRAISVADIMGNQDKNANTGIAQAHSTGFFRRLLNKLNF